MPGSVKKPIEIWYFACLNEDILIRADKSVTAYFQFADAGKIATAYNEIS